MARKKQEIQLQREIETQEEWEEVMAMEGLWVIDVYQEWCGPCLALVGNFRRLKNELGDPLLNFAIAKADTIDALEIYRGRCEPTFLFFAGGILTSYIHGANAPLVQKVITEQLASEHKILEGTSERKEVKDPVITRAQEIELERREEEEAMREAEETKGFTVVIIKPDAVSQGKTDDIINEIKEQGIEILIEEERELTFDEAQEIYSNLESEPYFDELVRYMVSGPCHIMVITEGESGQTIVKNWREMMGPSNVEQAKEEAPTSFRAKYGDKGYMNAVHGSSSKEAAAKELTVFFPNFVLPMYQKKKENIQITLAIVRPETVATKKNVILDKISEAKFKIAMYKEVQLTKEQAAEFYKEHENYAYFDSLVEIMSSGPIMALGLAKDEAIKAWKDALGPSNVDDAIEKAPKSLRAQFLGASGMNQFHGSDSEEAAKEELGYFFPMEQTVALIKPEGMDSKDDIISRIQEAGFKIVAQQEITITYDIASTLYPNKINEEYYDDLVNALSSGPSLFMVLSREGAVSGLRMELGDIDPEVAKTKNPDSLRALFGKDLLHNAVHGSSSVPRAVQEMRAVFGDLKFNEDGTLKGAQPDLDETAQVFERERSPAVAEQEPQSSDYDQTAGTEQRTRADEKEDVANEESQEDENKSHNAAEETTEEADGQQDDTAHHHHPSEDENKAETEEPPTSAELQESDGAHNSHKSDEGSDEAEKQERSSLGAEDKERLTEQKKVTEEHEPEPETEEIAVEEGEDA